MKIHFHLLDIVYKVIDDSSFIHMFGRSSDNQSVCVIDEFQPYFFVLTDDIDLFCEKVLKVELEDDDHIVKVTKTEIVEKKLFGKKKQLVKVFTQLPNDVSLLRKIIKDWSLVKECFEFDVPFVRRYLIDKSIIPLTTLEVKGEFIDFKSRVPCFKATNIEQFSQDSLKDPKILAFDIETYNPEGQRILPEKNPIIMLAFYGVENNIPFKKVITWKRFKTKEDFIEFVDGEVELINRFVEIIKKFKPDFLTGYFSDGFDFPYILTRAKKYNIDLDIGLDFSSVKFSKLSKKIPVTGIVHLDIFKFISKILARSLDTDSFSLDSVSEELLGEKKDSVDLNQLAPAWDDKLPILEDFCRYNLQDAVLTFKLCKKLLPNIEELVKIVGLPVFDIIHMGFSQLVEWYIFRQVQSFNELAPNNPSYHEVTERRLETYQGAFVFEPKPGLYHNIVVFDFRSLYPTIIVSHNLCLSTLQCSCCKLTSGKVPDLDYWFCVKKKGFLPQIIDGLITRRQRIKEILKEKKDVMLEARSESLKLLANSFYGYLGFPNARWYCLECARSTTAWARFYITKVISQAQKDGFEVLYSDTDSIFLSLNDKSKQDALHFVELINQDLPGIMELEYEGFYPSGLFVSAKEGSGGAKKKYALLREDDRLKITGFETVRKNWSAIAKEVQEKVLNIVLRENNPPKAIIFVKGVIADLLAKKISKDKVVIRTVLQKELKDYSTIGPHVAVAKYMASQGEDIGSGSVISYIICDGPGKIRDKAKLPSDIVSNYDADYYINNQIIPSVLQIFEIFNISKEELLAVNQSKLGEFF